MKTRLSTPNKLKFARYLVGLCLVANVLTANAACTNDQDMLGRSTVPIAVSKIISSFLSNGCYGGQTDVNTHTQQVRDVLSYDRTGLNQDQLEERFLSVKGEIQSLLMEYATQKSQPVTFGEIRNGWVAYQTAFDAIARRASNVDAFWRVDQLILKTPAYPDFDGIDFLDKHCPEISAKCEQAVQETVQLFRAFNLIAEVTRVSMLPNAVTHLNDSERRLRQWDDYFNKAEPLWPIELGLNSVLEMDSTRFDAAGNLQGFREVPNAQHLFLHPSTALEYFEDESSDSNLKPAVLLDIYGYNRLFWNKSSGRLKSSHGLSLIASFSSHEDSDDLGWGFRYFNLKGWSIGVTKHNERVGVFLSMGLTKQLSDWQSQIDQWKEKHEEFRKQLSFE